MSVLTTTPRGTAAGRHRGDGRTPAQPALPPGHPIRRHPVPRRRRPHRTVLDLPHIGLAVASLRSTADNSATGWWEVFAKPTQLTLDNYVALFGNERIVGSLWNTVLITVPIDPARRPARRAGRLRPGLDRLQRPRRAGSSRRSRSSSVPVQVAIIPDATIFRHLGIYGQIPAVIAFHVAFGLPFAILSRSPTSSSASPATCSKPPAWTALPNWGIFRRAIPARRLARHRVAGHLPVPLGLERPARRPGLRIRQPTHHLRPQRTDARLPPPNIDVIGPGSFLSMVVPLIVFFAFQRLLRPGRPRRISPAASGAVRAITLAHRPTPARQRA